MTRPDPILGRYELRERLGAGGSAEVFLAHDRNLDRFVAVKLLDEFRARSADPAGHARFLREGRTSARFTHPNVVNVYDAGNDDGRLFIVLEYVAGTSLAQRIADAAPLPDAEVVDIGTQLLGALGAAHAAGLVHRDVKPANVLIDESGTVKLADFGIAQHFDEITGSLTADGMVVGTRDYLAPEQARGERADPRTDLYAVGAVLYEACTGQRPPRSPADAATGADPRSHRPDIDSTLATTITTAMAGSPDRRFQTAGAMSTALRGAALPPTAAMPLPILGAAPTEAALTTALPGVGPYDPSTRPMPQADSPSPDPDRRTGRVLGVMVAVLLAVAVGAAVIEGGADPEAVPDEVASAPPTMPASSPPTQPTTITPTSAAPNTTLPTTVAPTSPPTEPVERFLATDDPDEFIELLRADGDRVAGSESKKLGNELRRIRREKNEDKQSDRIDELADDIEQWVEDGKLHPAVATRALGLLDDDGFLAGGG